MLRLRKVTTSTSRSVSKFRALSEQLKSENKTLKARVEELNAHVKQLEETIKDLTQKLNKANYIINKASEGDGSIMEDDDDKQVDKAVSANLNQSGDANSRNKTDGFSKKSKGFKIDKNDKEIEEYLKSVNNKSSAVKFSKFTQTAFDPLRSLIDFREKLQEQNYPAELVKQGIDALLKLLGYKGLDDLLKAATARSTNKKKTLPGQPAQGTQQMVGEDDFDYEEDGRDNSPEPVDYDPNLYPKMPMKGTKKPHSKSPPRNNASPYPQREDDYDQYATSKKLVATKPQPKKYTDKDMREEERQFKQNLGGADEDQDEYEIYLSKMKIEKELTMFRMYLNIKRRYFKDPAKFIRTFRHYFGREPPKIHPENLAHIDSDEFLFSFPEFKEYYANLMHIHDRCGEECVHLQRWYKKFGINPATKGRKYMKMHHHVIDHLPKSIPRRENSLDKLVKKYYKYY